VVVLNKIYTRTGDDGTTALGTGDRVRKDGLRVEAYGAVDEANAALGMVCTALNSIALDSANATPAITKNNQVELKTMLGRIQNDLFDLGADLCVPDSGQNSESDPKQKHEPLRVTDKQVDRLETDIDRMNAELAPLRSFVLPGGTPVAASLHMARTICRRAERRMVELAAEPTEPVSGIAIKYINRLSDFLFVASRYANRLGEDDVLWVPGQNR